MMMMMIGNANDERPSVVVRKGRREGLRERGRSGSTRDVKGSSVTHADWAWREFVRRAEGECEKDLWPFTIEIIRLTRG